MRPRFIGLMLGVAVLAQTGCKCCRPCDNVPPPPPPYSIQASPPPAPPIQPSPPPVAPAVGMLPAYDPDRVPAALPLPQANPTVPTSFNRLTSGSR